MNELVTGPAPVFTGRGNMMRAARFASICCVSFLLLSLLAISGTGLAATPSLVLDSAEAQVGAGVSIRLSGFPAAVTVRITFDGASIARLTTSSRGRAAGTIVVPNLPGGQYPVRASACSSRAKAMVRIVPGATLVVDESAPGERVGLQLTGFGAREKVEIRFVSGEQDRRLGSTTTGSDGGKRAKVRIPTSAGEGPAEIRALGVGGVASDRLSIVIAPVDPEPSATVSPEDPPSGATVIWVDPINGSDDASGSSRGGALKTLDAAWRSIPAGSRLVTEHAIKLLPGTYPADSLPGYMERRYGTSGAPISIVAADGPGTVVLTGGLNIFDVTYLTLKDLVIRTSGDVVHCERCDHFWIRNSVLDGQGAAHETLKVNQSTNVFLYGNDIGGSYENAIDFVAVQHGRIEGNLIHDAEDWCIYLKGGSADFWLEGNEIYGCGTGGFSAGQGTGFQFMTPPYITYEAEEITFIRNAIHDTDGAGMGVNGGRNILLAENRLTRIGARSHLLEITYGGRSCDGRPGDEGRERCAEYLAAGGWGTTSIDDGDNYVRIPNKNVTIRDNVFENPSGYQSRWRHFFIPGPFSGASQAGSNAPDPALADDGLVITGNVIVNGDGAMPLGVGDEAGCRDDNPTCNEAQLYADNDINGR